MPLKKIKTDSITDDAITAVKIDDDGTGFTFGDLAVTGAVDFSSTASIKMPSGTTAQRGASTTGALRFNSQTPGFEGYDGTSWGVIGGGSTSELATSATLKLTGTYEETLTIADAYVLTGDVTLNGNFFTAKLTDDGNAITITDDGNNRTITGQGSFVPGAMYDDTFAIATPTQPNITSIGTTASIKVPTGTTAQRGTSATGAFRFNTTDANFEGYDGTEWGEIGGGGSLAYTKETFTATANQTTFTLASKYTLGYIDVYLNGIKLIGGDDFTATSTSAPYTVVLSPGVAVGNVVQTMAYNPIVLYQDTMTTETFTATANQTTFTLVNAYSAGFINVYLNGIKLVVGTDVTASNGSTVVLIAGADVGDTLQTEAFGTFSSSNTVPATGGTFSGNITIPTGTASGHAVTKAQLDASGIDGISSTGSSSTDTVTVAGNLAVSGATLTLAGMTSNLSTFTSDLTVAANYSMAVIGPVTIPNVTINGNLNVMTELNVTGDIDTGANGSFNIIG